MRKDASSKLWFNNLVRFLTRQGYGQCPTDPCIMCKIEGNRFFVADLCGRYFSVDNT